MHNGVGSGVHSKRRFDLPKAPFSAQEITEFDRESAAYICFKRHLREGQVSVMRKVGNAESGH